MAKIFITGITGFLGSNIAGHLVSNGHEVAATYRVSSSKALCHNFEDKITWILQDESWEQQVVDFKPAVVIHSAWLGVGHVERNLWESQVANIEYIKQILFVAKAAGTKKFIGLGSQAEYGLFSGSINEDHPIKPTEAYGCVKVVCSELVKQYCEYHHIDWYWLRLFSFFGKGESDKWLIPTLVNKLITADHMDLTPGEQQYAYLYVEDLGAAINKLITGDGESGIYNISGKHLTSLRDLVEDIRDQINPGFQLNFGKLDYRENQPMHMQGDSSKFVREFGEFDHSDFNNALAITVDYIKQQYIKRTEHESI